MAQAAETRKRGKDAESPNSGTSQPPATNQAMSREQLVKAYGDMLLIRRFEEKAGQLYGMGLIGGFCHLYIGQEAVVVGIQTALSDGDQVITSYRDHGHMLATGMDPRGVMAELTGRSGGYSKGKGGSMHMFSKEKRFFGGHGIVGAQVSLGTGLAMANWYRGSDRVCATYFGDGASSQGQVYESFNLAALMKLPCVKAAADVAVAHCRSGAGPYLMEIQTYRYRGHSMSDPAKYRTRDEVQKMRTERDCIEGARHLLEAAGMGDDEFKAIDAAVKARIQEAADFAQSSPEPDERELWTDVLVEG